MAGRGRTLRIVAAFVLIGAVCVGLRYRARRQARMGRGDTFWRLTYAIEFEAEGAGAELQAPLPCDTRRCRVFGRDFRSPHLTIDRRYHPTSGNRQLLAVAPEEGEFHLRLRFDLHLSPQAEWQTDEVPVPMTPEARAQYLQREDEIQLDAPTVAETLAGLRLDVLGKAELAERLFEYCRKQIISGGKEAPSDAEGALRRHAAGPLGRARAMVALCRASNIPARLVAGFRLREGRHAAPHHWVEVLADGRWVPYDPEYGFSLELPDGFLPVRRDNWRMFGGRGISELESTFTIVQLPAAPGGAVSSASHPLEILDLTRLPLEMHEVLSLILLMPLGALVTCVFRNIIGIRTSGTFTPMLLPLAGLRIPHWNRLLAAAIKLGDALEMGYVGVDFVLDARHGPVVLEANGRPGLAIQIAHGRGLVPRLKLIDAQPEEMRRPERRMELVAMLAELH